MSTNENPGGEAGVSERTRTVDHSSRQMSWWSVHEYVKALLTDVESWPMVGTPSWCNLADDDPRKLAAIYDAAQHWALRVETCQEAMAEASRDIAAAADWPGISREMRRRHNMIRRGVYIPRRAS